MAIDAVGGKKEVDKTPIEMQAPPPSTSAGLGHEKVSNDTRSATVQEKQISTLEKKVVQEHEEEPIESIRHLFEEHTEAPSAKETDSAERRGAPGTTGAQEK